MTDWWMAALFLVRPHCPAAGCSGQFFSAPAVGRTASAKNSPGFPRSTETLLENHSARENRPMGGATLIFEFGRVLVSI